MAEPKCRYVLVDFETTGLNPETDYPIEIGALFLDKDFVIIDTYNTLIKYDKEVNNRMNRGGRGIEWIDEFEGAYKIHGITVSEWLANSSHVELVAEQLQKHVKLDMGPDIQYPILMSDNIIFEAAFMKRLLNIAYPNGGITLFHYHGYDTSMLLHLLGMKKVPSEHRAMRDVSLLYVTLLKAIDKVGGINVNTSK